MHGDRLHTFLFGTMVFFRRVIIRIEHTNVHHIGFFFFFSKYRYNVSVVIDMMNLRLAGGKILNARLQKALPTVISFILHLFILAYICLNFDQIGILLSYSIILWHTDSLLPHLLQLCDTLIPFLIYTYRINLINLYEHLVMEFRIIFEIR